MKRKVAPDSPQSMGVGAPRKVLVPQIVQQAGAILILAPREVTARIVASVSCDRRG